MPGAADHFRTEAILPIQNKIGKALISRRFRNMLAQPNSTITLRRLIDEGALVICNLAKGGIGESTAQAARRVAGDDDRAGRAVARQCAANKRRVSQMFPTWPRRPFENRIHPGRVLLPPLGNR
jgi:hypothetical protein